ncbi:hypothetical protein DL95DRAFT_418057 [Leptodontidium sp. 2 PMI_412]|nr:hypothetical protein DL95DRAFT_418057 [Leptodontidium sp. 2 PMI_412]
MRPIIAFVLSMSLMLLIAASTSSAPLFHVSERNMSPTKPVSSDERPTASSTTITALPLLNTPLRSRQASKLQTRGPSQQTSRIVIGIVISPAVLKDEKKREKAWDKKEKRRGKTNERREKSEGKEEIRYEEIRRKRHAAMERRRDRTHRRIKRNNRKYTARERYQQ